MSRKQKHKGNNINGGNRSQGGNPHQYGRTLPGAPDRGHTMKKEIIGHVACPVCPHPDAQVKEDKNGHAFIFCPDCAAQTFTRNDFRDGQLRRRMRPVTVTVTEPLRTEPTAPPVTEPTKQPVPTAKAAPPPKAPPPQKKPPAVDPAPPAQKKNTGWFQPLIGRAE